MVHTNKMSDFKKFFVQSILRFCIAVTNVQAPVWSVKAVSWAVVLEIVLYYDRF